MDLLCLDRSPIPARLVGQITWLCKILSSPSGKHKSLYDFAKSVLWCPRSVPSEGRIAIVTDAGRECGGRGVSQRSFGFADEGMSRTVKSCGPGIPVLMPNLRCDERADDGGKKAGPRGDHV
jgi:hypothetical protein